MARQSVIDEEGIRKMTLEKKFKKTYSAVQLADFLRQLAALIDGTTDRSANALGARIGNFKSAKLKIKRHPAGYSVKLKLKSEKKETADSKDTPPEPNILGPAEIEETFKQLKKRMKSFFKLINENLVADRFPDKLAIDAFLLDVDRMAQFPDQCGDRYSDFKEACDGLLRAFENEDFDALRDRYADVKRMRDACHREKK